VNSAFWTVVFYFVWMLAFVAGMFVAGALFLWSLGAWNARRHGRYGRCRVCGCTDGDCSGCIRATRSAALRAGLEPPAPEDAACYWIDDSHTLCSRCVDALVPADVDDLSPDCSPLNARRAT
jgi:hypothetical protein